MEQNDAIAYTDCKRAKKCCDKQKLVNQFGAKQCVCLNCGYICRECTNPYIERK